MINKNLLHYRVAGNGYPVVFLHGFLETMEMWEVFSFPSKFQCIYIDLPGHGESKDFVESAQSMHEMALEVLNVLDYLKIDSCTVVGHSMGGYVGLEMSFSSDKVNRLILLNSNFWEDSANKKIDRKRVAQIVTKNKSLFLYEAIPNLFNRPENHDEHIKSLIQSAQKMEASTIGLVSIAMSKRRSFESEIDRIKDKMFIIQGKYDQIVPVELMNDAIKSIQNSVIEYTETGHMSHLEATNQTQMLLEKFM